MPHTLLTSLPECDDELAALSLPLPHPMSTANTPHIISTAAHSKCLMSAIPEDAEDGNCQGTPSKPRPHHEVRQFRLRLRLRLRSRYSSIYSPTPTIYPLRQDVVIALLTKPSRRRDGTSPRLLPYREIPLLLYFSIVLLFHCL